MDVVILVFFYQFGLLIQASFEHDMLGNTKIRSQFSLFGVDYEGEVNLRAGDVEKELLIDVRGTRRTYITVKYMADLTKLQLKGKRFFFFNLLMCFLDTIFL